VRVLPGGRREGHGRPEHEPGEELLQLDWLELPETPWGEKAYVLIGVLSHSGWPPPEAQRGWVNFLLVTAVKIALVVAVFHLALGDPAQVVSHITSTV
jgi:hypothetical protein